MELSDQAVDLLFRIAKCKHYPDPDDDKTSCQEIFEYQENPKNNIAHLLPVPWQGHLEKAKVLFVSSNPSELPLGIFADKSWLDKGKISKIVDYFECRFDKRETDIENKLAWSKDGIRYRKLPITPVDFRYQGTWRGIRDWAAEIDKYCPLGIIVPGETYALTEIVHCYSKGEVGVEKAKNLCSKYFRGILGCAINAKIIAVMGDQATPLMNNYLRTHPKIIKDKKRDLDWHTLEYKNKRGGMNEFPGMIEGTMDDGRKLKFIALPSASPNNQIYQKKLRLYLTPDELENLKAFCK